MSVGPVRPITAAEAALRVQTAPEQAQVLRIAGAQPIASPQASNFVQIEMRNPASPPPEQPPPSAAVEPTPALAVRTAMQANVARQAALGPLLADLAAVVRTASLPLTLRSAAVQLLAFQPFLPPQPTGVELRRSVSRSGLFLEARLAQAVPPGPGEPPLAGAPLSVPEALRGDAKAHLLAFRAVLQGWLAAQPGPPPAVHVESRRPPAPPYAAGPTEGQPPSASTLPADAPPAVVVQRLMQAADGVLARQELLQMASLRDASPAAAEARNWMFELPLETPQGPAVAQFEIARDGGRGASGADLEPSWRARFSVNVEPLGPVHAHVSLRAGRTSVSLWAERPEVVELLRAQQDALTASLRRSGGDAEVAVRSGAPPARVPGAGQFVDEAT